MSKPSILIYGPQGCGKSTNAQALADFYGLTTVRDEVTHQTNLPLEDTLLLAERVPAHTPEGMRTIPFTIALKEACLAGWRPLPQFGLGASQIIQILGIDPKRLVRFTLESDGETSMLTVVQRPPESQSAGYLTQRFNLVEIGEGEVCATSKSPELRLSEAAQDLLDALKRMLESVTGVDQISAVNDARAAISKATGVDHD